MSPIFGLSERTRMPRLGKIHLGVKVPNKTGQGEHPEAVDYFVLPPELHGIYGERPDSLEIVFPSDDTEIIASQWRRAYSATRGLVCKGDGATARRLVDVKLRKPDQDGILTGPIARAEAVNVEWCEGIPCPGPACPYTIEKACRPVMNLQFMLPRAPGLGIWQLDTSSVFSIINVNSGLALVRGLVENAGVTSGVSMLPLQLSLIPMEVSPDGKKKTIHVLQVNIAGSLSQLAIGKRTPLLGYVPPPDEAPDDLIFHEANGNLLDSPGRPAAVTPARASVKPGAPQAASKQAPAKAQASEQPKDQEHYCTEHQTPFEHHEKVGTDGKKQEWWSHKLVAGGYCNERKAVPVAESVTAPATTTLDKQPLATGQPVTPADIGRLLTVARMKGWTNERFRAAILKQRGCALEEFTRETYDEVWKELDRVKPAPKPPTQAQPPLTAEEQAQLEADEKFYNVHREA